MVDLTVTDETLVTDVTNVTDSVTDETNTENENFSDTQDLLNERNNGNNSIQNRVWLKYGILILLLVLLVATAASCLAIFLQNGGTKHPRCPISSNDDLDITADNWAKEIDHNNASEIHGILSKCSFSKNTAFLVTESVHRAYNDSLDNFPTVLKFVSGIISPWLQYTGYSALQAVMHKCGHDHTNETIKLVYFIKISMQNKLIDTELRNKYKELTKLVPENISLIIFNQCVSIRNNYYNEVLFLSNVTTNSQRLVMTRTEELQNLCIFQHAFWYFEADNENDTIFFRIINHYNKSSSICPSPEHFDMQSQYTVECPEDHKLDQRWAVTPVTSNQSFTIKSGDGHLLYSPNDDCLYDSDRRYTFTSLGPSEDFMGQSSTFWDILKCPPCNPVL